MDHGWPDFTDGFELARPLGHPCPSVVKIPVCRFFTLVPPQLTHLRSRGNETATDEAAQWRWHKHSRCRGRSRKRSHKSTRCTEQLGLGDGPFLDEAPHCERKAIPILCDERGRFSLDPLFAE